MTTQYEGLDTWSETIDHVTDDDTRDASAYAISAIGLADRTRYLKNRGFYSTPAFGGTHTNAGTYRVNGQIIFTNTSGIGVTYATARRYARTANLFALAKSSYWDAGPNLSTPKGHYVQLVKTEPLSDEYLIFDFDIPSNCILKRFVVRVDPAAHTALPENLPEFDIYYVDTVAGTTTLLVDGTGIDNSATFAAYNALHTISVDLSIVYEFDTSRHRVFMRFKGEWGLTDAKTGLVVHLPTVEFERAQIGEEFGELVP
jgi:hypothetical protein